MKLYLKKCLVLLSVFILICTSVFKITVMNTSEEKDDYVVISQDENERIVEVVTLTDTELQRIKKNNNYIIDKNNTVYGFGNKSQKNKKAHAKEIQDRSYDDLNTQWNYDMINYNYYIESLAKVKVALIDSGIDYTEDIDVAIRKNFIPEQDEISILYEDLTGHGTSIAGILAAKNNDDGISGLNSNIELYSARVLDENLSAPISRVTEAIYWAIDQKVNIISISFGTSDDSNVLHQAIKDASEAGILIIAAAGNNNKVEYPAAYEEVIAVGSVDSSGTRSEGSGIGSTLELMAPGDLVLSTSYFGGVAVNSGTSMAVPHVVGIASLLWGKDLSCDPGFIRFLLSSSANLYGSHDEYGFGLIDYYNALKKYDNLREKYEELETKQYDTAIDEIITEDNDATISTYCNLNYVEGLWGTSTHESFSSEISAVSGNTLSTDAIRIVKLGVVASDTYIPGMTAHPEWHGFISYKLSNVWKYWSNYISSYVYLTEIASAVKSGEVPNNITPTVYLTTNCQNNITKFFNDSNGINKFDKYGDELNTQVSWQTLLGVDSSTSVSNKDKALFIYGMALHTATDIYAHSTYTSSGTYITHPNADSTSYDYNRYECAQRMAQNVIAHIKRFEYGSLSDFYDVITTTYDGTFKLGRLSEYANEVDSEYYSDSTRKAEFDACSIN